MNIGEKIAQLRKEKNLTQENLANILNVSAKTISSYETNRSLPNIETLILMANLFNVKIDTILNIENQENIRVLNKSYEKKNFKDYLIEILFMGSIIIVPILFFWYAGYVSMAAIFAQISLDNSLDNIVLYAKNSLNIFNNFFIEYLIYLLIAFLNFLLYKKKHKIILFIINGIIFGIFTLEFLLYFIQYGLPSAIDSYIFLLVSIIGLILAFRLPKNYKNSFKN